MTSFGDDDPEDAWDAGDPTRAKVDIVRRIVPSIADELYQGDPRRRATFRLRSALSDVAVLRTAPDLRRVDRHRLKVAERALIRLAGNVS